MFFPLKFVAANIFMAGVTAGAIGGAAAVYVLSDQQRREKLKDCAEKCVRTANQSGIQSQRSQLHNPEPVLIALDDPPSFTGADI